MTRHIERDRKRAKAATTPRQIAMVVPHAAVDAGATFESALEVLGQDLSVYKLWQAERPKSRAKRRAKTSA